MTQSQNIAILSGFIYNANHERGREIHQERRGTAETITVRISHLSARGNCRGLTRGPVIGINKWAPSLNH